MKQKLLKILYMFLAFCARIYLARTRPFVIGVTGSVGKTCCRDIITQVLKQVQTEQLVYTSPKNYNSELGLIFSIFKIESYDPSIKNLLKITWIILKKSLLEKKQFDILVAEYGIDSSGDMDFLLTIMKPDIAILTKLDSVHSDNFKRGISELWEDKWKLLLSAKCKVYFNAQDEFSIENIGLLSKPYETTFEKQVTTQLVKIEQGLAQKFKYTGKEISINLLGDENIEYTILGLKITEELGIKLTENTYDFQYILQPGRFTIFERNGNIFIDSSYNAGPESMKKIIENTQLVQKELYANHKIVYVLGDMREIGDVVEESHESLVPYTKHSSAIFTVGPYMYEYLISKLKSDGYTGEIHSSLSSREIGKKIKKYLKDNQNNKYIVLFKGSQNTIFTEEALSPQLLSSQQKNLPRCSEDWKRKKDEFFKSL